MKRKPRILIVDDSQATLEIIANDLKSFDYDVVTANNGKSAIAKARANDFDLFILDVILPDINGYEVCSKLKSYPETKDTPVIFLTVQSDTASILKGFEIGGVDYITKPFKEPELQVRVKTHINLKLYQQQLKEAKMQAEKADMIKTAFLSNLSHEIRTPMNAIVGFSELILMNAINSEDFDKYLNLIYENGITLTGLIDDIIEISKIEAGEIKLNYDKMVVENVLEDIQNSFEVLKQKKAKSGLEIKVSFPDVNQPLSVFADILRVKQILNNLMNNALKFTKEGYIELGYKIRTIKKGEISLIFFVKDTGVGIPSSKYEYIFGRFNQLKTIEEAANEGTGLGLAITKTLVEYLDGKIWLESGIGKGTTFYVELPFKLDKLNNNLLAKKGLEEDNLLKGKVFLLVDDVESVYFYFLNALKSRGVKIIYKNSGVEAIKEYEKNMDKIDLILMDIQMPGMDGYETTRKIKEINPNVKIIAQTALSLKENIQEALDAGCDDYILKPIKLDELYYLIGKHLS